MIARRRFLRATATAVAALPASLVAGASVALAAPGQLHIPGASLAGCVNSWRVGLSQVVWDEGLVPGCFEWAQHLAEAGFWLPQKPGERRRARHSLPWLGRECLAGQQKDWAEAFRAWTISEEHVEILGHEKVTRVGMAGYADHRGLFWVLRLDY